MTKNKISKEHTKVFTEDINAKAIFWNSRTVLTVLATRMVRNNLTRRIARKERLARSTWKANMATSATRQETTKKVSSKFHRQSSPRRKSRPYTRSRTSNSNVKTTSKAMFHSSNILSVPMLWLAAACASMPTKIVFARITSAMRSSYLEFRTRSDMTARVEPKLPFAEEMAFASWLCKDTPTDGRWDGRDECASSSISTRKRPLAQLFWRDTGSLLLRGLHDWRDALSVIKLYLRASPLLERAPFVCNSSLSMSASVSPLNWSRIRELRTDFARVATPRGLPLKDWCADKSPLSTARFGMSTKGPSGVPSGGTSDGSLCTSKASICSATWPIKRLACLMGGDAVRLVVRASSKSTRKRGAKVCASCSSCLLWPGSGTPEIILSMRNWLCIIIATRWLKVNNSVFISWSLVVWHALRFSTPGVQRLSHPVVRSWSKQAALLKRFNAAAASRSPSTGEIGGIGADKSASSEPALWRLVWPML
mmetsp:Transcript_33490/g.97502  ORF Transcript_33490/g.97502 Transcript_33490/m.97502 type:complete len:481 (-) Transcript_33490:417-1859(-)